MTTIPDVTALPDWPQTSDPAFSAKADALGAAMAGFVTSLQAMRTAYNASNLAGLGAEVSQGLTDLNDITIVSGAYRVDNDTLNVPTGMGNGPAFRFRWGTNAFADLVIDYPEIPWLRSHNGVSGFGEWQILLRRSDLRLDVTIADDAVLVLDTELPFTGGGFIELMRGAETVNASFIHSGRIGVDIGDTPNVVLPEHTVIGSSITVASGALTGTTGVDGDFTVSAVSGAVHIENRLGFAANFSITLTAPGMPT